MRRQIHANISQEQLSGLRDSLRGEIETLRGRVEMLSGKDRVLMTMYLENGNSFRQIARVSGVSETSISRRIHRISKRLMDGAYVACLRNRGKFSRVEMLVAKDCFVRGLPQRDAAAKYKCSHYRIRQIVRKVQEIVAASKAGEKAVPGRAAREGAGADEGSMGVARQQAG